MERHDASQYQCHHTRQNNTTRGNRHSSHCGRGRNPTVPLMHSAIPHEWQCVPLAATRQLKSPTRTAVCETQRERRAELEPRGFCARNSTLALRCSRAAPRPFPPPERGWPRERWPLGQGGGSPAATSLPLYCTCVRVKRAGPGLAQRAAGGAPRAQSARLARGGGRRAWQTARLWV